MTGIDRTYEPDLAVHHRYAGIFAAYRGIYPGLKSTFQLAAEIES